jgi:hypothetical protein
MGSNTQHTVLAMLRQAVYGRLAGYDDVNPGAPEVIRIRAKVVRHTR